MSDSLSGYAGTLTTVVLRRPMFVRYKNTQDKFSLTDQHSMSRQEERKTDKNSKLKFQKDTHAHTSR